MERISFWFYSFKKKEDRINALKNLKKTEEWGSLSKDFEQLCIEKLCPLFGLNLSNKKRLYEYFDSENVWEWCEFKAVSGWEVNISRSRLPLDENPVRLSISAPTSLEEQVALLGKKLYKILGIEVYFGTIHYIQGDEFKYEVKKIFNK